MLDIVFAPFAALFTLAERSRNRRLLVSCGRDVRAAPPPPRGR
ncbi:hypothetical protein [Streptomyces scabiei]